MTYNDVLSELAALLELDTKTIKAIFQQAEYSIEESEITNLLKREEAEGFVECQSNILSLFLDGLIIHKRGKRENSPSPAQNVDDLTNNDMLKKLRIALELKEEDLRAIFTLADFRVSKSELSALFRKKGHKNYQECGNQFLRNFFRGLKKYTEMGLGNSA